MNVREFIAIIVFFLVMLYPYIRIIRRTGHSGWWILIMFVPIVNFIMLWVFAFAKWPAVDRA
jgi:uncharacterized membrane protein YhaH (DUF805 family)